MHTKMRDMYGVEIGVNSTTSQVCMSLKLHQGRPLQQIASLCINMYHSLNSHSPCVQPAPQQGQVNAAKAEKHCHKRPATQIKQAKEQEDS